MNKLFRIRVVAPHDCWISKVDGDPGRTRLFLHAELFSHLQAVSKCNELKEQYHHRNFIVEPAN